MFVKVLTITIKMATILKNVTSVVSTLFRKVFHYKTQKVYKSAIDKSCYKLFNIPDLYKTPRNLFLISVTSSIRVEELFQKSFLHWIGFFMSTRRRRCVKKLLKGGDYCL